MKKFSSIMAVALTVSMLLNATVPALADTVAYKEEKTKNAVSVSSDKAEKKASPDSMIVSMPSKEEEPEILDDMNKGVLEEQVVIEVDGAEGNNIVFYMKRDSSTNEITLPEPVTVTVKQISGQAIGEITTEISPVLNEDRERIRVESIGNTNLSTGTPVQFSVSFVDKNIGDETDRPRGSSKNFYIRIVSEADGSILRTIPVMYGADGFYTRYSADYMDYYKGTVINRKYVLIGEVNLNQQTAPTFTIEHYYKPMTGTEGIGISEVQLNPDGQFTFADGSTTMTMNTTEEGWLQIPVTMRPENFQAMRSDAISKGRSIDLYTVFDDLLIVYDDGYMSGGTMNPLPLVYHILYRTNSSNNSGGSGGSGGGGGGGSSGGGGGSGGGGSSGSSGSTGGPGGSGTVVGPTQTVRTTIATQNDIGWITIDGQRYYMNAENKPVTDWLQWTDGKWYYFGSDGIMKIGWTLVDGKWYLLNQDGSMATGLVMVNQQWHLLNPDGSMATGWAQDPEGNWRYFGDNGVMTTNYTTPDGKYIGADGIWRE